MEYYTVEEVAKRLRLSKMSVYRLIEAGELTAKRFGRALRIPVECLKKFEENADTTKRS